MSLHVLKKQYPESVCRRGHDARAHGMPLEREIDFLSCGDVRTRSRVGNRVNIAESLKGVCQFVAVFCRPGSKARIFLCAWVSSEDISRR